MTYTYLDTSALAKIYLDEPGSERAIELLRDARAQVRRLFVASIGYPEAISALSVAERTGRVSTLDARRLMQRAEQDFTGSPSPFHVIDLSRHTTERAAELVRRHRLRGFDAVHLSTAIELRDAAPRSAAVEFAATDARLVTAAEAESLPLMDW